MLQNLDFIFFISGLTVLVMYLGFRKGATFSLTTNAFTKEGQIMFYYFFLLTKLIFSGYGPLYTPLVST